MEQETSNNVFYEFEKFVAREFNPDIRKQLLVEVQNHCDIKGIKYNDYLEFFKISLSEFEESILTGNIEKEKLLLMLRTLNLSLKQAVCYLAVFDYTIDYDNRYEREILSEIRDNYRRRRYLK